MTTLVPRVFRRAGMFYVIELPEDDDLAKHARLNPGTLRIEDVHGKQLWPPRLASAIEARRAAATKIDAVHESAVAESQTPNNSRTTP